MNNWCVATQSANDKYFYSFPVALPENNDILGVIEQHKNGVYTDRHNNNIFIELKGMHSVPTKKKAHELADFWNECYKKNGTYLFDL